MEIDNQRYFRDDIGWWDDDPDSHHVLLRYFINPLRFNYFKRVLGELSPHPASGKTILDVGCGGGYLTEEFAKIGLAATGLEPSPALARAAREHAAKSSLPIAYVEGFGENMPFENSSFDLAACCDVLEHVDDLGKVISEISRVLKPGGLFFFDTINRTVISYFFIIKIAQDWKFTAWEAPRTHVFDKFVKPSELKGLLAKHGLRLRETRGISPGGNPLANFLAVRQRARGRISRREMGAGLKLHESDDVNASYLGYAVKD